jgi:hypothetical protein
METLLMDPISAMIGGGASIIGSLMNTSSAQSINSANLQMQQQMQTGAFLPAMYKNMVEGANAAGLNPLAVLGIKSPGGGPAMAPTNPGQGLQDLGRNIAQINVEKEQLDLQARREEVMQRAATTKQTSIDIDTKQWLLDQFKSGRMVPPGAEPASTTTIPGAFLKGGQEVVDWGKNLVSHISFDDWRDRALHSMAVPPVFSAAGRFYDYLSGR